MSRACRWVLVIAALLYAAALGLLAVGTFGLFGNERGPLAGIFLVPLGLPWIYLLDRVEESLRPWLAAASPLLNLALLAAACHFGRRRATSRREDGRP